MIVYVCICVLLFYYIYLFSFLPSFLHSFYLCLYTFCKHDDNNDGYEGIVMLCNTTLYIYYKPATMVMSSLFILLYYTSMMFVNPVRMKFTRKSGHILYKPNPSQFVVERATGKQDGVRSSRRRNNQNIGCVHTSL